MGLPFSNARIKLLPIPKLFEGRKCSTLAHLPRFNGDDTLNLAERLKIDRYPDQNGNMVFTERFLIGRKICCGLSCKHCPYSPKHKAGNKELSEKLVNL